MSDDVSEGRLNARRIDCILYNRRAWREALAGLEPRAGTSVVTFRVTGGPSDSRVERLAIKRATLSGVLDLVDRTVRRMPRDLRTIDRLKYREGHSYAEIGRRLNYSVPTIERRVRKIRDLMAVSLAGLPGTTVTDFWREVDGHLMR